MVEKKAIKNKTTKNIDNIIKYLDFMNKPHIKILNLVYLSILLIIFLSFLLKGYNYIVLNVEFIKNFKNNNTYLTNFLFFVIGLLFIKVIVSPIHIITKLFMYKLPKITFIVYTALFIYIIYNTYNIQKIFVNI
tara:strand:+ start:571 stop:972 length:402 start_codon:yes stop_codon:yes gene_type:complete